MSPELDEKLVKKYPKIFENRHSDPMKTAMCWGFECDNGWYWLIDKLCEHVQQYIDINKAPQIVATQVKEKFGGLRFYYDGGNQHIDGIVSHAEHLSYSICEICGTHDKVGTTTGWNKTLCMHHWLESKFDEIRLDNRFFVKDSNGFIQSIREDN